MMQRLPRWAYARRQSTTMPNDLATVPLAGAERMRRHRWLRQQGGVNINLLIGADAVRRLSELGWLTPAEGTNRDAVTSAVVRLAAHALGLRPTP